ncbi:hypothetical protein ACQVQY_32035 [Bacillus mycoides]|uniref:hypothetical protein n=1 Tax=Bacillus mycoides TaxID=1405 RepID=UPI003D661CD1
MRNEKELLRQWKADLQVVKEEKQKKKKHRKKSKKNNIPGNAVEFLSNNHIYYKKNGVWKQRDNRY